MPGNARAVKAERVCREGAECVRVGSASDERAAVALRLATQQGLVLVSSTEHPEVIAGQGTVGLEIVDACLGLAAVALAAWLAGAGSADRHAVCVASGGNVDPRAFARVVGGDGGPGPAATAGPRAGRR